MNANNLLPLLALFFILLPQKIFSQNACDTLLLKNDSLVFVEVYHRSNGKLFYRICGENEKLYAIPEEEILRLDRYAEGERKDSLLQYKSWIVTRNNQVEKGRLYILKDKSVVLKQGDTFQEYSVDDIEFLKLKKKGRLKKGIIAGAAIGFLTGIIINGARKSNQSNEEGSNPIIDEVLVETSREVQSMAVISSSVLAGAIVGGVISQIKIQIPIKGKQENYQKGKQRITF